MGPPAEAGFAPSVELRAIRANTPWPKSVFRLFKIEVVNHYCHCKICKTLENATLFWLYWYNNQRSRTTSQYVPPVKLKVGIYDQLNQPGHAALLSLKGLLQT
ncbi:IS3 family transposase [Congregibacter litoralis]|uniref:IS3 family transposase n=1 Tax=Congregibacter litoralis TaxID=393662 RepID=UPI0003221F17